MKNSLKFFLYLWHMPSTAKNKKANLVFPSGADTNASEIVAAIKDAEKGPFYTATEVKQQLKKWSKRYSR